MNLRQIDLQKRKIEAKYIKPIRTIFRQMNKDAIALFKATGNIPAQNLAQNFTPEFTKVIRDAMRESVLTFGFLERKKSQKSFQIEKYQNSILVEEKDLDVLPTDDEIERVDKEHAKQAILFISTESQRQALYIENTNAKELTEAQQDAIIQVSKRQAKLQNIVDQLTTRINVIRLGAFTRGETAKPEVINKLQARLEKYQNQLEELKASKQDLIAEDIEKNLEAKEQWRSELIAETSVGIAESWSRNEEAVLLAGVLGIQPKKRWVSIIDGRTRPDHIVANGQMVGINQKFIVGGERANFPRDSSLSSAQLLNCRCGVEYLQN